jgi:hypothetical protein
VPTATLPTHPTARPDVVLRRVGSEWVLFDARGDRSHALNLTGALVWTYCDGTYGSEAMATAIASEVADTASDRIRDDIELTLKRFATEGLLR